MFLFHHVRLVKHSVLSVLLFCFLFAFFSCSNGVVWGINSSTLMTDFQKQNYDFLYQVTPEKANEALKLDDAAPYCLGLVALDDSRYSATCQNIGESLLRVARDNSKTPFNKQAGLRLLKQIDSQYWTKDVERFIALWKTDKLGFAFQARLNLKSNDPLLNKKALQYCRDEGIEKLLKLIAIPGSDWKIPYEATISEEQQILASVYVQLLLKMNLVGLGETTPSVTAYFYRFPASTIWYKDALSLYEASLTSIEENLQNSEKQTSEVKNFEEQTTESSINKLQPKNYSIKTVLNVANARSFVAEKRYGSAFTLFYDLLQTQTLLSDEVYSDAGKAFLYGGTGNFKRFSELWKDLPSCYMTYFYRGRFYEKQNNLARSVPLFEQAILSASSFERRDAALWYMLENIRKSDISKISSVLMTYGGNFESADYFEDFFDELITDYVANDQWKTISTLYQQYQKIEAKHTTINSETLARLAFVTARAIQENYIEPFTDEDLVKQYSNKDEYKIALINKLFLEALSSDHGTLYYRTRAAEALSKTTTSSEKKSSTDSFSGSTNIVSLHLELQSNRNFSKKEKTLDVYEIQQEIDAFMKFGLYQKAFLKIQSQQDKLSNDYVLDVAKKFAYLGENQFSLRVAVKAFQNQDRVFSDDDLCLMYPQFYKEQINKAALQYSVEPSLLFGLIRSESFFSPTVVSSAGAIGLSQLMPSTAKDVARRLKMSDYDLNDPYTNALFGSFYLSDLIRRNDGNILDSLFAYNAGPTRVKRWRKQFSKLPDDLFLEIIPYTETRNYGRKVLAARAFYQYLYE